MSEVSERYETIAQGFTDRLEGVADSQWSTPTPCTDWVVRDLVSHVVGTHLRVLATLDETGPVQVDPDDPPKQWPAAHRAVVDALVDGERASKVVSGPFGEQPFESLVGRLLCADTLIHTWDLARATGQDEGLDAGAVSHAAAFLTPIDTAIRRPGGFGAKIDAPPDADEQTKLLNFAGRAV